MLGVPNASQQDESNLPADFSDETDSNEEDETDDEYHTALGPECFEFTPASSAQCSPEGSDVSDSVFATPVNSPPRRRRRTISDDESFSSRHRDLTPDPTIPKNRGPTDPIATSTPVKMPVTGNVKNRRTRTESAPSTMSSPAMRRKARTRSEDVEDTSNDLLQRLNSKIRVQY